jgi:hypothetical protein
MDICVNLVIGNSSCRDEETTGRIYRTEREFSPQKGGHHSFLTRLDGRPGLRHRFQVLTGSSRRLSQIFLNQNDIVLVKKNQRVTTKFLIEFYQVNQIIKLYQIFYFFFNLVRS